jgi:hypothetical protein
MCSFIHNNAVTNDKLFLVTDCLSIHVMFVIGSIFFNEKHQKSGGIYFGMVHIWLDILDTFLLRILNWEYL